MNKPIILADIDGCLLQWLSKMPEFLMKKGIDPTKARECFASGEYLTAAQILGLPSDQAMELVREYNSSVYMRHLTPFKDSLAVVNLLKEEFDFVAVTAMGTHPLGAEYRMENLHFWYPNAFKGIHVVDLGESKYDILKEYHKTFFIDDTPKHIKEAKDAGHIAIRIVRDSRPDITNSVRFDSFHEIGSFIEMHKHMSKPQQLVLPPYLKMFEPLGESQLG